MSISQQTIEQMAPDQASLNAASKLMKPAKWPVFGRDGEPRLIWGECQGSGSTPYRVVADLTDLGYKCTCPSRKFPCKHVLALLWFYAGQDNLFSAEEIPQFVTDWLGRRRGKASTTAGTEDKPKGNGASIGAIVQDEPKPRDEKAEARAAAQRKRALENREKSMKAGLDELDRWIGDQLDQGLAAFMSEAQAHCRQMAQRLVDAKVSGLATAVDALPSELFSLPEAERPGYLIERLGGFHLLAEAYRRQDSVSDALRADLRRLAGWAQKREDLLTDGTALRVKGSWLVFAVRSEVQPDRLRRTETWLARCDPPETDDDSQQFAVLMDFNPVAGGSASSPFSAGEFLSAELVFYPSAAPLRALIDKRGEIPEGAGWPARRLSLADALADYYAKLAIQPWLPAWPIVASGVRLVAADGGLGLTAPDSNIALPIDADAHDGLLPLLGLEPIDMFGLWDGRKFSPMAAATPIGPWLGS